MWINKSFVILLITFFFVQESICATNLADQRFLDNADQFSEETGIKLYSRSRDSSSGDVYLPPTTEKREDFRYERLQRGRKEIVKKRGFSFADMSRVSRKKQVQPTSLKKALKTSIKRSQRSGFTFSNMAKQAQKQPSLNRTVLKIRSK